MNQQHSHLFLWRGRSLVIGPGIDSKFHAHFATQLTWGLDAPFQARLSPELPWTTTRAAIFFSNQPHQIHCESTLLAHLFIELPQRSPAAQSVLLADYRNAEGFAPVRAGLAVARTGGLDLQGAEQLTQDWLACSALLERAQPGFDQRISQALAAIAAHPRDTLNGAALAAAVHLSASRFTHLFRQQTGLSLSRYLLWSRLLAAVEAVARGDNMTHAAHAAGFADLAHMSRTFRNTFGVVPSELQKMAIAFKREEK
ncbi:AraC-like DNA-binding protein [Collimonas sp. PA-H2]|uniref:helix-turn-helix transcriptional regulator n=1 Tax=Collimonas sp. PA-H2 TaxID=1881062 RepID=UPI000BF448D9|nr:AraC family transcriptional regulator [Collimonas sp. PA-H2]PFH08436.1 AraC-like DNA-binding protein [Collimonas sp. PA-H2]